MSSIRDTITSSGHIWGLTLGRLYKHDFTVDSPFDFTLIAFYSLFVAKQFVREACF